MVEGVVVESGGAVVTVGGERLYVGAGMEDGGGWRIH